MMSDCHRFSRNVGMGVSWMSASMTLGRVVNFCNRGVHTMVGKLETKLPWLPSASLC